MTDFTTFQGEFRGARRGSDFLRRIESSPPNIWYRGELVKDVRNFAPLRGGIETLASLYDYQWKRSEIMLVTSEDRKISRTFSIPKEKSELHALGKALTASAQFSQGMLGREPAYMNRSIASFAGCSAFFDTGGKTFSNNVVNYFNYIRNNDLSLTHTLLNPKVNRQASPALQNDPTIAAHITKESDSGFFVSGARLVATLPFADEIAVFPARLMDTSEATKDYAFAFAIPTTAKGLKFLCRDSVDYGLGKTNHPLSSRFEEMDAVAIFDNVFIPWERVFCYRDIDICNRFYDATGATAHISYQVVCKNIVKTEFFLGLISLMTHGSGLDRFQHIHEKTAEIWVGLQAMKAFKVASEAGAKTNSFGMLVPDWDPLDAARYMFPRLYPRMVEIVQQIGASGLVALPTKEDLNGPLKEEIEKYFQTEKLEAAEKIDLYRLAWDVSISAFAGRQTLYERFFFGDPVQMATRIFRDKNRVELMERVNTFIHRNY
ncbi:4-hydroxyphenylacetate 3-monooxygenase [Pseudomonas flavescens]|uniref:4-hydroxyphenylacetate 3-monooxygenase n=1 Tax=Phytopseudomonas flavescens TaxID=29435 RepID=A0A1G8H1M0_9GAMM|nr:4-hydroxyphenylacetate 3-monooxygenase, oxygenase component [Pseudomonas flavescens]SDI00400.1 4-hydroxyphenylacetate 3-monooxygenase [Pseudomonas flavescens]